jgi:hypothetical protein
VGPGDRREDGAHPWGLGRGPGGREKRAGGRWRCSGVGAAARSGGEGVGARIGDRDHVAAALVRGRDLLERLPLDTNTRNHFVIDPAKWDFYAMDCARRVGDDAQSWTLAETVMQGTVTPAGEVVSPMRRAEAQLTQAAVEARAGDVDQAAARAVAALHEVVAVAAAGGRGGRSADGWSPTGETSGPTWPSYARAHDHRPGDSRRRPLQLVRYADAGSRAAARWRTIQAVLLSCIQAGRVPCGQVASPACGVAAPGLTVCRPGRPLEQSLLTVGSCLRTVNRRRYGRGARRSRAARRARRRALGARRRSAPSRRRSRGCRAPRRAAGSRPPGPAGSGAAAEGLCRATG